MVGKDIIMVGQQAWDIEIGSNCKNIAVEFSKRNRVLYINPPLDRITKFRHSRDPKVLLRLAVISGKQKGLLQVNDNLWIYFPDTLLESINWIRVDRIFSYFNRKNNQKFSASIQAAINELNFSNFILFNDGDIFRSFYLKSFLKPALSIYYSRDNLVATSYWRRHGKVLEPKLIESSDICFANSEYLRHYCKQYNSNSYYVGQGCELDLFKNAAHLRSPKEFDALRGPLIGYVGALTSSRLDIELLEYIATAKPGWNVILVGPQDKCFKTHKINALKNVYFLGARNPEELPVYIASFDVCINPQILNEFTIGNYPRKIDEYLAMGKPVVATETEAMSTFKDFVYLARDKYQFVDGIQDAINYDDDALHDVRKRFAFSHTWEKSVELIYRPIDEYFELQDNQTRK